MDSTSLLKAMGIGFSIAAIIGPIGLLCLGRTIKEGFWVGLIAGIGAACADTTYSAVAIFSVTALSTFLLSYRLYLQSAGALYLLYLGSYIYRSQLFPAKQEYYKVGPVKAFFGTFFLTLANPTTIIGFFTLFASFDLVAHSMREASLFLVAVLCGSCMWWVILASFGHLASIKLNKNILNKINQISGIIVACFGAAALCDALWTCAVCKMG